MLILALDGGTKHAAATVTSGERQWRQNRRMLSLPFGDASTDLAIIMRSLVQDLLDKQKPAAIGVSFGGPVDAAAGIVPAALGDEAPLWGAVALAEDLLS